MKESRISLRVGTEETELLQKARAKLARDGKKQTITKTVRAGLEKIAAMPDDRPVLFFIDRVNIKKVDENISKGLELLQMVLDEFKAVAGDNLRVPDMTQLFDKAQNLMYVPMVAFKDVFFWQCYRAVDGKAEIIPEEVEEVKNQFRASAITPEEKSRLGLVMDLVKALDKFLDYKPVNPEKLTIPGVVIYDAEANRFAPGERFVKGYIL
jgi:hypothetical protein